MRARDELTQIIRTAFEDANIKQSVVAVAAGVKASTVSRWLSGDIILPPGRAPAVARTLGLDEAKITDLAMVAYREKNFPPRATPDPIEDVTVRLAALEQQIRELQHVIQDQQKRKA